MTRSFTMAMPSFIISVLISIVPVPSQAQSARDPGPRAGAPAAGAPLDGLTGPQTNLFNAGDKGIPTVDEDCWRAVEAELISRLRRVNELVLDRRVITGEISKYVPDPLVRQLPMRAPIEVLNRDLHA